MYTAWSRGEGDNVTTVPVADDRHVGVEQTLWRPD